MGCLPAKTAILLLICVGVVTALPIPIPASWCSWYSYSDAFADAGYCHISNNYFLTVPAEPKTFIAKFLTRAYSRQFLCSAYTTNATCSAQAASMGCSWSGSGSTCNSADFADWDFFRRHAYFSSTPASLFCPGSQAQLYKTCNEIGIDAAQCRNTSGCVVASGARDGLCQAAFMANMTQAQQDAWYNKFQDFDANVHGSCASVCYLKSIFQCSNITNATTCGANPYCEYDATAKLCNSNMYNHKDEWGAAVIKASALCGSYNSSTNCYGPIGAVINIARVDAYRNYTQQTDASLRNITC